MKKLYNDTPFMNKKKGESTEEIQSKVEVLESSLAQKATNANVFLNAIKTGTKGILIGDSITVGFDAVGAGQDPAKRIIFDNGTNVYREGKYESNSWANHMRRFCVNLNPSIDFINAGIDGSTIQFANINKQYRLPDSQYDFIIIALGTNDFGVGYTSESFKQNYMEFVQYAKTKSDIVICVSPIPRLDAAVGDFTLAEGEAIISDIAFNEKCIFVPMYQLWLNYFDNNENMTIYMDSDKLHPNDNGHLFMWKMYQKFFNFTDSQSIYNLSGSAITQKQEIVFSNGWTKRSLNVASVSRTGNLVTVCFSITGGTLTANTILFTLSGVYTPTSSVDFSLTNTDGTNVVMSFGYTGSNGLVRLGQTIPYANILIGNFSFTV
jgi:lysophospholipase L1-like esterase